ncbi:hypothetical protein BDW22DRAFT_1039213 [Trametopsis cervina]|nr:hypothetical protein BDW22DRAFT_1039213 [Trametopsis cervina]
MARFGARMWQSMHCRRCMRRAHGERYDFQSTTPTPPFSQLHAQFAWISRLPTASSVLPASPHFQSRPHTIVSYRHAVSPPASASFVRPPLSGLLRGSVSVSTSPPPGRESPRITRQASNRFYPHRSNPTSPGHPLALSPRLRKHIQRDVYCSAHSAFTTRILRPFLAHCLAHKYRCRTIAYPMVHTEDSLYDAMEQIVGVADRTNQR